MNAPHEAATGAGSDRLPAQRRRRSPPRRARRSSQAADRLGVADSAAVLQAGLARPTATAAPAWSRSRASACSRRRAAASRRPGMEVTSDSPRALHSQKMVVELLAADMPRARLQARLRARLLEARARRSARRASRAARSRRPTSRTRRWRSTSTPASSARAACARAARSRSTTSSATRSAARTRRSCSTSTTRWAQSTCVACGECVQACPTGALAPAHDAYRAADRPEGRLGVPVLRRRLPAHLPHPGQQDRARRGPRRPGEPRAAVREGPLRLRLRRAIRSGSPSR